MPVSYLIAGLGNPGAKYAHTRHNVGFMAIEAMVANDDARIDSRSRTLSQARCWTWEGTDTGSCLLAQPLTYMNLSGQAVRGLCRKHFLSPDQLLVIHDELDLPLGRVRMKFGGGLAGHNGLRSIAQELGTRDFYRLRIGIGRPEAGGDVTKHVLSSFPPWERDELAKVLELTVDGLLLFCTQGYQAAMNFLHAP